MQQAVGLSPAVTIVALLVGSSLGGIAGAILAVPLAAGIGVLVNEWPRLRDAFDRR
jgi:predicted PurR-regulated permease PerM